VNTTAELTPAQRLGMVELTTSEDGLLWLQVDSIYTVEKAPSETYTLIKTMMGDFTTPHTVKETPTEVAQAVADTRAALQQDQPFDAEKYKQAVRDSVTRNTLEAIALRQVYDELNIEYDVLPYPKASVYDPPRQLTQDERDAASDRWYDEQMGLGDDE
jgi:hypothetical protein